MGFLYCPRHAGAVDVLALAVMPGADSAGIAQAQALEAAGRIVDGAVEPVEGPVEPVAGLVATYPG